jgi:hypothetical protein
MFRVGNRWALSKWKEYMDCKNHAGVAAINRCAGCAEPFCGNCLVNLQGQPYCGACKAMAVSATPLAYEAATIPCKEANEALTYAIIGIFCFGIILEPIALVKASKAKKMMALNPRLSGSGKVTAAYVIAIIGLVLWVLGMVARFAELANHR